MKRRNVIALSIFLLFYVGLGVLLTSNQEKIVYAPFSQDFESCPAFSTAEKISYNTTRMYTTLSTTSANVILYHGNAGSACDRALYAHLFTQAGLGYIIVEYTGYSNDATDPSHEGVAQNVRDVIAYIESEVATPIYVVGESIGTGAASYHTNISPPDRLLLISPFTDLQAVARHRFWFYPTRLVVNNAFDNTSALKKYDGTLGIIHGTKDTLIPYSLGQALYESSTSPEKTLHSIEGAGHNDLFTFTQTHTVILDFLK